MTAKPPSTAPEVSSPQAGPSPASTVGAQAAIAGAAPTVFGLGAYVLIPLFALVMALWATRSIDRHTCLR